MQTIALLTDFGTEDIYVGVMKGIISKIAPESEVIDITHGVRPQSVREGAFALLNSYRYFPKNTIFVTVIDPGVGSTRKPIAVKAGDYCFIAPDNGVLSYVLASFDQFQVVEITNPNYRMPEVSSTFHGRDVFAPAAAHLAAGVDLADFGERVVKLFQLPQPALDIVGKEVRGEIIHIDHFGNLMTSIGQLRWVEEETLRLEPRFSVWHEPVSIPSLAAQVLVHGQTLYAIRHAFHESQRGDLMVQVDSNGYLEIAVNLGNAAKRLDAMIGDEVVLKIGELEEE